MNGDLNPPMGQDPWSSVRNVVDKVKLVRVDGKRVTRWAANCKDHGHFAGPTLKKNELEGEVNKHLVEVHNIAKLIEEAEKQAKALAG